MFLFRVVTNCTTPARSDAVRNARTLPRGLRAQVFAARLGPLKREYRDRLLPVTSEVAETWGRPNAVRTLPVIDGLLAATALVNDLTLLNDACLLLVRQHVSGALAGSVGEPLAIPRGFGVLSPIFGDEMGLRRRKCRGFSEGSTRLRGADGRRPGR